MKMIYFFKMAQIKNEKYIIYSKTKRKNVLNTLAVKSFSILVNFLTSFLFESLKVLITLIMGRFLVEETFIPTMSNTGTMELAKMLLLLALSVAIFLKGNFKIPSFDYV